MKKILLDTDIGSDIDDAVCLAYLLSHPECELLGITTVSGQAESRAMMADAMCRVAKKDIPIYAGTDEPLIIDQKQPFAKQAEQLKNWPHRKDFPRGRAVEFLYETIIKNPGEITFLTIGPLTNAALLFAEHPDAAAMLKEIVVMGGIFNDHTRAEWNIICDPHAANIVCRLNAPVIRFVGLDVTLQVVMDAAEVKRRFTSPILRIVADFADVWFESQQSICFHDPLTAVTVFKDGVCTFKTGRVTAACESPDTARTFFEPKAGGNHEIAHGVDVELFFEEYFRVCQGGV